MNYDRELHADFDDDYYGNKEEEEEDEEIRLFNE